MSSLNTLRPRTPARMLHATATSISREPMNRRWNKRTRPGPPCSMPP